MLTKKQNSFNPGDKILCLAMPTHYSNQLSINCMYTVRTLSLDWDDKIWLSVDENNGINSYEAKYFQLMTAQFEDVV